MHPRAHGLTHDSAVDVLGVCKAEAVGLNAVVAAEDDGRHIEGAEVLLQDLVVGHVVDGGGGGILAGVGPWRPTRGSLTSPSYLVRNRALGPALENNPEIPPSPRDEGLPLLHGLETNLATSLQTPQEA